MDFLPIDNYLETNNCTHVSSRSNFSEDEQLAILIASPVVFVGMLYWQHGVDYWFVVLLLSQCFDGAVDLLIFLRLLIIDADKVVLQSLLIVDLIKFVTKPFLPEIHSVLFGVQVVYLISTGDPSLIAVAVFMILALLVSCAGYMLKAQERWAQILAKCPDPDGMTEAEGNAIQPTAGRFQIINSVLGAEALVFYLSSFMIPTEAVQIAFCYLGVFIWFLPNVFIIGDDILGVVRSVSGDLCLSYFDELIVLTDVGITYAALAALFPSMVTLSLLACIETDERGERMRDKAARNLKRALHI